MAYEFIYNKEQLVKFNIKYPDIKLKFNIGDSVLIKPDAMNRLKDSSYIMSSTFEQVLFEIRMNNEKNKIIDIGVVIDNNGVVKIYYKINSKNYSLYVPEPCFYSITPTYNEPRKLVYEKFSFDDFLLESLEDVSFIISDELIDIISEIKHPISDKLLEDVDSQSKAKKSITLLDVDVETNNMWYFVNSIKAIQYITDNGGNPERTNQLLIHKGDIFNRHKSKAKIGKIIKKIYGNIFSDTEIESFVNEYKKMFITDFDLIDTVKGKEINYWYHCNNYDYVCDSTLDNSCMADDEVNSFMDFYSVNDHKVSLVIMYKDLSRSKIKARALLWKIDKINNITVNDAYFMDRVYFNYEVDKNSMIKYAETNNWYHKLKQNSKAQEFIYNPNSKDYEELILTVNDIKYPDNHKFPYVDTIKFIDTDNKLLSNSSKDFGRHYGVLDSTEGEAEYISWSNYYNNFISGDVIYAKNSNTTYDYVYRDDVIIIPSYNEYYTKDFINNSDMITVERIRTKVNQYIFKKDAIFSSKFNKYYWKHDVIYSKFYNGFLPNDEIVKSNYLDDYLLIDDVVKVVIDDDSKDFDISELDDKNINFFNFTYDYFPKKELNKSFFEYAGEYFGMGYKKIINNL